MRLCKKIVLYCVGLVCIAMGVICSIESGLGVSPMNSIPYVLSKALGVELGQITTIIFACFILIQILLLGKNFKYKNLLQLLFSSVFGYLVGFFQKFWCVSILQNNITERLGLLGISIIMIALGIFLVMQADLVPMPPEGLMLAIAEVSGSPFHKIKILFDTGAVVLASLLSFLLFHKLEGVGVGTLVAALGVGRVMGWCHRIKKYRW